MEFPEKVSLIVPFYNAEKYLEAFFESVLKQTFTDVQFILVNDGSTDGSEAIVKKYTEALKDKFNEFLYLKKENGGAASAVNVALKHVRGKYLTWADSDDILHEDNLKKKFEYLERNMDKGFVVCQARLIDEVTGGVLSTLGFKEDERKDNIFEDLIFKGVPCYPGVFMIRTNLLLRRLGEDREIYYNAEVGQNWQLLLPVAYDNNCGYIEDSLYDYYYRMGSHSHKENYEKKVKRTYAQEEVLSNILKFIEPEKRNTLMRRIQRKYILRRMDFAVSCMDTELFVANYKKLIEMDGKVRLALKMKYIFMTHSGLKHIFPVLREIKKRMSK